MNLRYLQLLQEIKLRDRIALIVYLPNQSIKGEVHWAKRACPFLAIIL
jgi:hypothetical protein